MKPNPGISQHSPVTHGGIFSIPGLAAGVIDFSSSINPAGILPSAKRTIRDNLDLLEIYPDSESESVKKSLEQYTGMPTSQIIVGNGATEILYNFCNAFLSASTPVLIPAPTFGEYEAAARLAGAEPSFFKTMNLACDIAAFLSKIPKNGCVFMCNPNNPTGTLIPKKHVKKIIVQSKENHTLLVVDECFIELVPENDESVMPLVDMYDGLFILRSLTKSFALAGMRLGYGVGSARLISVLNKIKIPWNVSGIAQKAATAVLSDPSYLDRSRDMIKSETAFLKRHISILDGFECHDTSTNFMLIKADVDSTTLQKKLLRRNILVRDCKSFRGLDGNHIRIAIRTRRENRMLVEALKTL